MTQVAFDVSVFINSRYVGAVRFVPMASVSAKGRRFDPLAPDQLI
jgi:hypothetical protein